MSKLRSAASFLLLAASTAAWAVDAPEKFIVNTITRIPGATLRPGTYTISLVNHLTDRDIIRVDSPNGKTHTTFIGIPNANISKPAAAQIVTWSNKSEGSSYVRGWYFPNASAVTEFVYPKADAVNIAKSNESKVLAIDPASEGRTADPALSSEDMRLVTLWLLSATTVEPSNSPAIKAERYQAPANSFQASNFVPKKHVINQLPHTAGYTLWLWAAAVALLFFATLLRRTAVNSQTTPGQKAI